MKKQVGVILVWLILLMGCSTQESGPGELTQEIPMPPGLTISGEGLKKDIQVEWYTFFAQNGSEFTRNYDEMPTTVILTPEIKVLLIFSEPPDSLEINQKAYESQDAADIKITAPGKRGRYMYTLRGRWKKEGRAWMEAQYCLVIRVQ